MFEATEIARSALTALLRAAPQLPPIHLRLLVAAPTQLRRLRIDHSPRIIAGFLVLDSPAYSLKMTGNFIRLLGEVAQHTIAADALVEDGRLQHDARLLVREARAEVQLDIEDAAVEVRRGPAEKCEVPDERVTAVGQAELHATAGVLAALVLIAELLALELELHGQLALLADLFCALLGPGFRFGVERGADALEAGFKGFVVESAFHAVGRRVFEFHALEMRAVFDFLLRFGDGEQVGGVVPEEAALDQVGEGIKGCRFGEVGRFGIVLVG